MEVHFRPEESVSKGLTRTKQFDFIKSASTCWFRDISINRCCVLIGLDPDNEMQGHLKMASMNGKMGVRLGLGLTF